MRRRDVPDSVRLGIRQLQSHSASVQCMLLPLAVGTTSMLLHDAPVSGAATPFASLPVHPQPFSKAAFLPASGASVTTLAWGWPIVSRLSAASCRNAEGEQTLTSRSSPCTGGACGSDHPRAPHTMFIAFKLSSK